MNHHKTLPEQALDQHAAKQAAATAKNLRFGLAIFLTLALIGLALDIIA
jgi:hypothetical protein